MRPGVASLALGVLLSLPGLALADKLSPAELAGKIDQHLAARWDARKVAPAPRADDAEWARRVHLDLTGRVPDILAARDFGDDPSPDKRARLIDRLLASDRYPVHWANVWRSWFLPELAEVQNVYLAATFEVWMREQLKKNTGYGRMMGELITTSMNGANSAGYVYAQSNLFKAENLASSVSRLMLGVKLECAQCHNHPFAKWKRQEFWEFAAFFNGINPQQRIIRGEEKVLLRGQGSPGEIVIPGTDKKVKARFLGGKEAAWKTDPRAALVEWMTARDNPYFSRAAVNRVWEYLLGTGLVEPVDEESADNPPSHPELLDLLAGQFIAHDFDLHYLIKAITLSRAYQLSSKQASSAQADPRLFARMRTRGLSPEQLFDSLALATGQKDEDLSGYDTYGQFRLGDPNSPRNDFLRRFPNQDKRTEQLTSILQALYLMNSKLVADATSLEHNKNLAIIAQATSVRTSRRIEQVFLITLARKPTPAESARLIKYVEQGGPRKDSARALCDVFWALLNSSEFCTNH